MKRAALLESHCDFATLPAGRSRDSFEPELPGVAAPSLRAQGVGLGLSPTELPVSWPEIVWARGSGTAAPDRPWYRPVSQETPRVFATLQIMI